MDLFPWLLLFPGLALALAVVGLRWLAEGLAEIWRPGGSGGSGAWIA